MICWILYNYKFTEWEKTKIQSNVSLLTELIVFSLQYEGHLECTTVLDITFADNTNIICLSFFMNLLCFHCSCSHSLVLCNVYVEHNSVYPRS